MVAGRILVAVQSMSTTLMLPESNRFVAVNARLRRRFGLDSLRIRSFRVFEGVLLALAGCAGDAGDAGNAGDAGDAGDTGDAGGTGGAGRCHRGPGHTVKWAPSKRRCAKTRCRHILHG